MRQFIYKVSLFGLPFLIVLFEFFLPIDIFTYRPWEALLYTSAKGISFPFYPNHTLNKISSGDLGHNKQYEILKRENWVTDKLGYRNNYFIEKPNIVLIGDSFFAGTGLPQDSTITNSLMSKLKMNVYNLAPATVLTP